MNRPLPRVSSHSRLHRSASAHSFQKVCSHACLPIEHAPLCFCCQMLAALLGPGRACGSASAFPSTNSALAWTSDVTCRFVVCRNPLAHMAAIRQPLPRSMAQWWGCLNGPLSLRPYLDRCGLTNTSKTIYDSMCTYTVKSSGKVQKCAPASAKSTVCSATAASVGLPQNAESGAAVGHFRVVRNRKVTKDLLCCSVPQHGPGVDGGAGAEVDKAPSPPARRGKAATTDSLPPGAGACVV